MVPRAINLSLTPLIEEFGGGRRKRPAGLPDTLPEVRSRGLEDGP